MSHQKLKRLASSLPPSPKHSNQAGARNASDPRALLEALLHQNGDALIVCDLQGQITSINQAARTLLGLSADEPADIDSETARQAHLPDGALISITSDILSPALEGETISASEIMLAGPDGETYEVEITASPLRLPDGSLVGAIATLSQVAPLQQAGVISFEQRVSDAEQTIKALTYQATLLENVSDAIVGIDANFIVTYWNKAAESLYGWTPAEAIGRGLDETLFCGLNLEERADVLHKLLHEGPQSRQLVQRGKDGRRLDVEATAIGFYDSDGSVSGYVAIVRDIYERKKIQSRLEQTLSRLRRLVDSNMVGITTSDRDGHIIEANDCYLNLTGFTRLEVDYGLAMWNEITPPEYREVDQKALEIMEATGVCPPFEKEYQRRDGSRVWVSVGCTVLPDKSGLFIAVVQDISVRKQAELERQAALIDLQDSQERLNHILESINDGFVRLDADWRFVYANRRAGEVAGIPPDRLLHQRLWDLWPELRESTAAPLYWAAMKTGIPAHFQIPGVKSDRMYEVNLYPSDDGVTAFLVDKTESIHSQHALQESEERFRSSIESLLDGFATLQCKRNAEGQIVDFTYGYVNEAGCQISGLSREEFIGHTVSEHFPLLPASDLLDRFVEVVETGTPLIIEDLSPPYLNAPAHQRIFDIRAVKMGDGIAITWRDVTGRKMSETLYRAIARGIPNGGVWVVDSNLRYLLVEGALARDMGADQGVLEGKRVQETVLIPEHITLEEKFRRALAGEMESYETIMGDRHIWTHFVPLTHSNGEVMAAMGLALDITDLKRAEEALIDRNARLGLLSEASNRLLQSDDPSTLLEHLSERLSKLLGLEVYLYYRFSEDGSHLELVSFSGLPASARKDFETIMVGEGVCGLVAARQEPLIIENVQMTTVPQTATLRDNGFQAYSCLPLIVHDQLIGVIGFGSLEHATLTAKSVELLRAVCDLVAIAVDRMKSEMDLHEYSARLEASNQELQEFAYVASHDMQEPLRKVKAFGETLYAVLGARLSEEEQGYFERMLKAVTRMQEMITDLLELSRVTTQGQPFRLVDLRDAADDVVTDLEFVIARVQGQVEIGLLPVIDADPIQIQRLLLNLVSNSLKYHREGVPPRVKISGELKNSKGRQVAQILVDDNGIGFDMQYLERIFQPFQRLHGRSRYEGTGMGLAICKKIVERHGGKITAKSTPGEGSQFIITLPVKHRPQVN